MQQTGGMKIYKGIAASGGIAIGPAFVYHPRRMVVGRVTIGADEASAEIARWDAARQKARDQLAEIQTGASDTMGKADSAIFEAHAMMLEDPALLEMVETKIRQERLSAPAAVEEAAAFYADAISALNDACLSDRAADVRDVAQRVIRLLLGVEESSWADLTRPAVVVARDLTPSGTASMHPTLVLGFCTADGGMTSHTAILARASGLPAVLGIGEAWAEVTNGETVIVDGSAGLVLVSPDDALIREYVLRQEVWRQIYAATKSAACQPAITRDGRRFEICANIGDVGSAKAALDLGAEGVGLLRTEFLFLDRSTPPDEEEQYCTYRAIADVMENHPLIVRTLDVGGDKPPPYLDLTPEMNPFLGWRGVRISLAHPELLKTQLRAILRAGVDHNVKIMFPMIASLEQVRAAKSLLQEAREELRARGVAFGEKLEVGIMVEVPSAAVMADLIAPEVDFFSLGTNDLTQYTLAVDRGNARVAPLYDALHPAVLRLIKTVIDAGHRAGKWVGMCGEMAGDGAAIPLLVGLGLDEFSMNAPAIPAAKELIRRLDSPAMNQLAARALQTGTAAEIRALVGQLS